MKKVLFLLLFLCGCRGIAVPDSFRYKEIETDTYKLASWQKITDKESPIRIYIEGDGYAFNHLGYPTTNPTPRGTFLREIAFNDPNPNVVYLARPCQFVKDAKCNVKDWTTGRFSQDIVDATGQAIKEISRRQPIILVGYSGGALLSGLVINQNQKMPVKKWITLAGVLNHTSWTNYFNDAPLVDSVDLEKMPKVDQIHFVGEKDKTVPLELAKKWSEVQVIQNATHDSGWNELNF